MIRQITLLSGITTTTTSSPVSVEDSDAISIQAYANNMSTAGSVAVQISNDGVGWTTYRKIISNVMNTNAQQIARDGGITLTGVNNTVYVSLEPTDVFRFLRVVGNVPEGGSYSVILNVKQNKF